MVCKLHSWVKVTSVALCYYYKKIGIITYNKFTLITFVSTTHAEFIVSRRLIGKYSPIIDIST